MPGCCDGSSAGLTLTFCGRHCGDGDPLGLLQLTISIPSLRSLDLALAARQCRSGAAALTFPKSVVDRPALHTQTGAPPMTDQHESAPLTGRDAFDVC